MRSSPSPVSVALAVALAFSLVVVPGMAPPASAEEAALQVAGALPKTGALGLADLEAMKPVTATWSGHEVYGVPLERVLTRFGFDSGPMTKDTPKREKKKN